MSHGFFDYLKGEAEYSAEILELRKQEIAICTKFWDFLDGELIKSVDRNTILFMYFKQQATIALHLAISSILRLHAFQSNQNLRYALDCMAICFYILQKNEECNDIFLASKTDGFPEMTKKLKSKAFQLMVANFSRLNEVFKTYKGYTNDYGAHVNLAVGGLTTSIMPDQKTMHVDFFDELSQFFIGTQLLSISDIILGFIQIIIEHREDPKMLPLHDGVEEKLKRMQRELLDFKKKSLQWIQNAHKTAKKGDLCWCGSGKKFEECHEGKDLPYLKV